MTSIPPKVLTIAGSDSSGGAGIQADIKTLTGLGIYAASVITSVTAQNSTGVVHRYDLPSDTVKTQIQCLLSDIEFSTIKIGMIPNKDIALAVAECLCDFTCPIILDPVINSTSGNSLISNDGKSILKERIIPISTLITPNISECAELLHESENIIRSDIEKSAYQLYEIYQTPVLLKGGHLSGDTCIDTFFNGDDMMQFKNRKIKTRNTHGTGCTLSSCIAGHLAKGCSLSESVDKSIQQVQKALKQSDQLSVYGNGYGPINHLVIN